MQKPRASKIHVRYMDWCGLWLAARCFQACSVSGFVRFAADTFFRDRRSIRDCARFLVALPLYPIEPPARSYLGICKTAQRAGSALVRQIPEQHCSTGSVPSAAFEAMLRRRRIGKQNSTMSRYDFLVDKTPDNPNAGVRFFEKRLPQEACGGSARNQWQRDKPACPPSASSSSRSGGDSSSDSTWKVCALVTLS